MKKGKFCQSWIFSPTCHSKVERGSMCGCSGDFLMCLTETFIYFIWFYMARIKLKISLLYFLPQLLKYF